MSIFGTDSSNGLGKQSEIGLFSPSLQVDSGIPAKDDGGRGIRDSEVDTAKTSDHEENQLIRRKLGLSKKQSDSYTSRVLQNTQSLHPRPSKQKANRVPKRFRKQNNQSRKSQNLKEPEGSLWLCS